MGFEGWRASRSGAGEYTVGVVYGRGTMGITGRRSESGLGPGGGPGAARGPLARVLRGATDVVLPAVCLACSGSATGSRHLGLCLACRGRLARPPRGCATCGVAIPAAELVRLPDGWVCGDCRRRPPAFEALLAPWAYRGPVEAVVQGLKFRRLDYLGRHLARDLRDLLAGRSGGWDLVVPVPLHWRRRWLRGYNQAERIARPLASLLEVPFADVLRRCRATRPQTGLAREARLANPRGAFAARRRRRDLTGRRVVLVDDVATTGATLGAAAAVLVAAGAAGVTAVAAARTPEVVSFPR